MPTKSLTVNRKSFIVLTFLFIIIFALSLQFSIFNSQFSISNAQQTPLQKAQSDYTFQFTKYRDAQEKYISAKSAYESFKTATAKNDAFITTKDYETQINKLYIAYILLVQENGNAINFTGHGDDKNKSDSILKSETDYFNEQNKKVALTKTLEELPPIATDIKTHLETDTVPKINKALAIYEVVQAEATLEEFKSLSRILDRVVVFKLRVGETKSILNNWTSEIKDIQTKTEAAIAKARQMLAETQNDKASEGKLGEISETTKVAKQELKRSQPLFEEVVRII